MTNVGVHLSHCGFGEYVGSCKYGEDKVCPALVNVPSDYNDFDELFKFQPKFDWVNESKYGKEPDLRTIVFRYYAEHFDELASLILTEKYLQQIKKAYDRIYDYY